MVCKVQKYKTLLFTKNSSVNSNTFNKSNHSLLKSLEQLPFSNYICSVAWSPCIHPSSNIHFLFTAAALAIHTYLMIHFLEHAMLCIISPGCCILLLCMIMVSYLTRIELLGAHTCYDYSITNKITYG